MSVQPPNPKKLMGDKKPPLHLLPLAGMVHQSLAHLDGNLKYGFENWNDTPVEKLTYIGAAMRHLELYKYGESYARDTTVHNLGGVMACCAILLDAELNGNLIDNTRHSKAACDLLHAMEDTVKALKAMQDAREAEKNMVSFNPGPFFDATEVNIAGAPQMLQVIVEPEAVEGDQFISHGFVDTLDRAPPCGINCGTPVTCLKSGCIA